MNEKWRRVFKERIYRTCIQWNMENKRIKGEEIITVFLLI